jgi:hypothetical protein
MPLVSTSSDDQKEVITGAENRQAWMLIGSAIRMAYGLGLDQVGYYRSGSDAIVGILICYLLRTNSWQDRWMAERSHDIVQQ